MSEIVVETTPQETIIEIDGGPTLTTTVEQEQQTLVEIPAEPVIIDLNSGARGEPGSAILVGPTFPNMTQGTVGDMYIVSEGSSTGTVLIKRENEWTIEANIRGPAGGIDTVNGYTGPNVTLTKADVGLNNVDNTSDANKPISLATQNALNAKQDDLKKGTIPVDQDWNTVVEMGNYRVAMTTTQAQALPNFPASNVYPYGILTVVTNQSNQVFQTYVPHQITNATAAMVRMRYSIADTSWSPWARVPDLNTMTKSHIGLSNVDNTSDANKPISTATATALAGKVNLTGAETIAGNKTFSNVISVNNGSLRVGTSTNGANYVLVGDGSGYTSWGNPNIITAKNEADNSSTYTKSGVYAFETGSTTWTGEPYGTVLTAFSSANRAFQIIAGKANLVPRIRIGDATATNGWLPWVQLADDSKVVHLSGSESITGTKTFTTQPIVPTPTAWNHAAHKQYVDDRINATIDAAPGTLDTLNELAAALGDDPNFATTVTNSIATKEPIINTGPAGQFYRADKTWAAPTPAQVGLGNVTNDAQVRVNGDQTILNVKTFAGDTWVTKLRSSAQHWSTSESTLGTTTGDYKITRMHTHIGSTNNFHTVDMVVRAGTTADWLSTHSYQGISVDTSFMVSPTSGTGGTALRTWLMRDPEAGILKIGHALEDYAVFGPTGVTLSGTVSGSGSGLTSLNGSNISSGTVADARLSSNVPLKNGINAFTNVQSIITTSGTSLLTVRQSGAGYASANAAIHIESDNTTATNIFLAGKRGTSTTFTVRSDGLVTAAAGFSGPLAASDLTGTIAQARIVPNVVRVEHGGTASTARPTGATFVEWVGSVLPTNMANGDTWINTSTNGNTADNYPAGTVVASASAKTANPNGWYWMEGQQILISGDTALYNELTNNGTTFPYGANTNGAGAAGTTHFRLPDMRGKTIVHVDGTTEFTTIGKIYGTKGEVLTTAQIPAHTHPITDPTHRHTGSTGTGITYGVNRVMSAAGSGIAGNHAVGYGGSIVSDLGDGTASAWSSHIHQFGTSYEATGITVNANTGGGGSHNNVQPSMMMRYMVKR